jgi:DNA polymerase-3 subunit epsilon
VTGFVQPELGGVEGAPWHLGYLASYDCETTGTFVETDRIVTAALVVPGREPRLWMADPGIDIPVEASNIHGVTTEIAKSQGQPAALVVDEIAEALADELATRSVLIVMNAPFDLTILDRECIRYGLPTVSGRLDGRELGPIVDPLVLDRAADKRRKGSRKLEALATHYGVKLTAAHTADADAQAALDVALKIAEKYPQLQVRAELLHHWQIGWHGAWAENFETYLRGKGSDEVISRAWPVQPFPLPAASLGSAPPA